MKLIYRAKDGAEFETEAECLAHEAHVETEEAKADRARRKREDFEFMVTCSAKGSMGLYHLLRDRSLDLPKVAA